MIPDFHDKNEFSKGLGIFCLIGMFHLIVSKSSPPLLSRSLLPLSCGPKVGIIIDRDPHFFRYVFPTCNFLECSPACQGPWIRTGKDQPDICLLAVTRGAPYRQSHRLCDGDESVESFQGMLRATLHLLLRLAADLGRWSLAEPSRCWQQVGTRLWVLTAFSSNSKYR
jgi:hypothetical protein